MLKMLWFHVLLLLMVPILWHLWTVYRSEEHPPATPPTTLSDTQQSYRDQIFNYAMEALPKNGSYRWQDGSASGAITVGARFVSRSRAICRSYSEALVINGASGTVHGFGCKRVGEDAVGWCRLPEHAILTCALEPPSGPIGSLTRSASEWLSGLIPGTHLR